eukprot:12401787-Karenia_brevis.AAC.1
MLAEKLVMPDELIVPDVTPRGARAAENETIGGRTYQPYEKSNELAESAPVTDAIRMTTEDTASSR